ncbi:hypothetical protein AX769_21930 (plasmid) [Frondihabitans sp. PAMC 28766]|uniref:hypothetical protein n=1 Tax=Frondihabitans sp. PAMC 28766 TaxID=1795630 RepID=UPI00078C7127|nr:hypothetical protein [Frondihabitans sp. PAMC 28766]AMM22799.1 hypothetical protein AX769_21930 [Frondihabitans sp. PAMC 28766]
MAEVRKSGKQTAARQRAREKAAEFREKQDKLEQLATDYFVAADSIEEIQANVEREIEAARERGEKLSAEARAKSQAVIISMLDLGTPRNEVAGRLGISTRDVKKTTGATSTPAMGETGNDSTENGDASASE